MAALKPLALALALAFSTPAMADPVDLWRAEIAAASARFGVPVAWIERVMRAESGGRTTWAGRPIASRAGAMGLMQLMPATWAALRDAHGLGADPHDPRDNILAGTAYLRAMYDRFGYPGMFAAYNAGPARYAAHLATGLALPAETRAYLAQVSGGVEDAVASAAPDARNMPRQSVFVVHHEGGLEAQQPPSSDREDPAPDPLFVIRRRH